MDVTGTSNMRPICLLDNLGKLLERCLAGRLRSEVGPKLSSWQFGFTKGKSTEQAINIVRNRSMESSSEYEVGIFLEIKGAFDRAWCQRF